MWKVRYEFVLDHLSTKEYRVQVQGAELQCILSSIRASSAHSQVKMSGTNEACLYRMIRCSVPQNFLVWLGLVWLGLVPENPYYSVVVNIWWAYTPGSWSRGSYAETSTFTSGFLLIISAFPSFLRSISATRLSTGYGCEDGVLMNQHHIVGKEVVCSLPVVCSLFRLLIVFGLFALE